jgi:hypothetical protein
VCSIDEATIGCGLSANWVVLTRDRLISLLGPLNCIID